MSEEERRTRSALACEKLYGHMDADVVLCYYPLGDEIDLRPLYSKLLAEGRKLYFPVTEGDSMTFYLVDSLEDFAEGAFHVMEPTKRDQERSLEALMLDDGNSGQLWPDNKKRVICITPGAVFDRAGNRMGYGKGYYDRFFAQMADKSCEIFKIAVAYNFQIIEAIDTNPWDVRMDRVIEV